MPGGALEVERSGVEPPSTTLMVGKLMVLRLAWLKLKAPSSGGLFTTDRGLKTPIVDLVLCCSRARLSFTSGERRMRSVDLLSGSWPWDLSEAIRGAEVTNRRLAMDRDKLGGEL